jgi:hypothetical protein
VLLYEINEHSGGHDESRPEDEEVIEKGVLENLQKGPVEKEHAQEKKKGPDLFAPHPKM